MKTGIRGKWATKLILVGIAALIVAVSGCDNPDKVSALEKSQKTAGPTPEEKPYYDAAKPFVEAVASRDYSKAYGCLSSHAKARMSPNQFVAPEDDAAYTRNEASAARDVTPEKFVQMLAPCEKQLGKPSKLLDLHVFSTDAAALTGRGANTEEKLESMFAIGMMPASIPAGIRKASLRSKLKVELSPEQLAQAAKDQETTPEKLKNDPEFQPYLNLKLVLVEEAGALKVGYFEFMPPGLLD
jgi:hypothetical protein